MLSARVREKSYPRLIEMPPSSPNDDDEEMGFIFKVQGFDKDPTSRVVGDGKVDNVLSTPRNASVHQRPLINDSTWVNNNISAPRSSVDALAPQFQRKDAFTSCFKRKSVDAYAPPYQNVEALAPWYRSVDIVST